MRLTGWGTPQNEVSMEMIVVPFGLLILALPIWLIVRAIISKNRIDELLGRLKKLEMDVARLRGENSQEKILRQQPPAQLAPTQIPDAPPHAASQKASVAPTRDGPIAVPPVMAAFMGDIPPILLPPPLIEKSRGFAAESEFTPSVFANKSLRRAEAETEAPSGAEAPVVEKDSFEMRVGKYWLVRVGILIILTSLAFAANLAYHNIVPRLGPGGKITLLYLAGGVLLGAGAWLQRRSAATSLKNYAQVLFAGGLAAVYFTTYAAHHIPPLRVIGSPVVDGSLLLVWAGVIAWIADRRKSEVMALFAVGLAFYSSVITSVGDFTLYSNLVLTVAAVVFLLRNRWANLSFAGLVTSYAGYAFWRFFHNGGWRWATPDEGLNFGAMFLATYWLLFTVATFLSLGEKLSGKTRAAFVTLNNGAFFGLFILTMLQVHAGGFWKFSLAYGATLLALGALARKKLPDEALTQSAYLTQGLLLVTLGFISKFAGLRLALVLGMESVVLFLLGTQRRSAVVKFFAYAAALLATGWCVANLNRFDERGLWIGAALGAFMTINALRGNWLEAEKAPASSRWETMVFTLLALASWLAATCFNTTDEHLPLALAAEAVALTLSFYLLRVREIALFGQGFLVLAQVAWLVHFRDATPPWWNPLALIAVTVGLSHLWQRQKTLVVSDGFGLGSQTVFAIASVALVLVWLQPLVHASAWLTVTSLLAVAATLYGVATRAWPLAICGQGFLVVAAAGFFTQIRTGNPEWFSLLAPLAVLALLSFATVGWFARKLESPQEVSSPLLQVARVYRWIALAMSLCWLWQNVPDRWHVCAFMGAAVAVFVFAIRKRNSEALLGATIYALVALVTLWSRPDCMMEVYWADLTALLALLVMQQVLRRRAAVLPVDGRIHGAIIYLTGLSLWRFFSCWTATVSRDVSMTMVWAGFAVLVFSAGMILRERCHRWFGFGVLAAAVGRVVLVDVWKHETIYRMLTFMALGVALLVVGFIYNKFQDKIRNWL